MTTDIEVYEPAPPPATLFGTDDPREVVARATAAAKPLADVVNQQRLYATISGQRHVRVEGWCLLGSMLGVFPITVWTRMLDDGSGDHREWGWEARVEARTRSGDVVGAAEAQCDRSETTWKNRDGYALRSMAQTRATSKALRVPLGFVMVLAGYNPTPAEEMPRDEGGGHDRHREEPILDPDGTPFPDQQPGYAGQFAGPETMSAGQGYPTPQPGESATKRGTVTEAQLRMIRRLVKKLEGMGQAEDVLRDSLELQYGTRHFSELDKQAASTVITSLKGMAGEETN